MNNKIELIRDDLLLLVWLYDVDISNKILCRNSKKTEVQSIQSLQQQQSRTTRENENIAWFGMTCVQRPNCVIVCTKYVNERMLLLIEFYLIYIQKQKIHPHQTKQE